MSGVLSGTRLFVVVLFSRTLAPSGLPGTAILLIQKFLFHRGSTLDGMHLRRERRSQRKLPFLPIRTHDFSPHAPSSVLYVFRPIDCQAHCPLASDSWNETSTENLGGTDLEIVSVRCLYRQREIRPMKIWI